MDKIHQYPIQDYSYSLQTVNQTPDSVSIYLYNKLVRGYVNREYNPSFVRLMLLVLGRIETNPGPRLPKYPRAICGKACKWGKRPSHATLVTTSIISGVQEYILENIHTWRTPQCHGIVLYVMDRTTQPYYMT